jgi:hypothetical protein
MPTSNKITYIKNGQPVNTDAYPLNKMVTWPGIKKYHEMLAYEIPRLGSNNRIADNVVNSFSLGSNNTVNTSLAFVFGTGITLASSNNERPIVVIGEGAD